MLHSTSLLGRIATIAALAVAIPALAQSADDARLDAAVAFARTYGVVRYFHPSDSLERVDWDRFLVHGSARMAAVRGRAEIAPRLEALFEPIVEGFEVVPKGSAAREIHGEGPVVEWRHLGYGVEPLSRMQPFVSWRTHHEPAEEAKAKLAYSEQHAAAERVAADSPMARVPVSDTLEALVPVSMPMSATKVGDAQAARLDALAKTLESASVGVDAFTREQAWADGIAAWNVARHFYPYWSVVSADWDGWLRQWLAAQPATQSREQLRDQLRRLVAPLGDGHAGIAEPETKRPRQLLPISVRPLGNQWVVDASLVPERVRPGDAIVRVDGKPAGAYFESLMAMESGSPQYVRWATLLRDFRLGPPGGKVALRLERAGRQFEETLTYDRSSVFGMPRPDPLSEVKPGIWYVDLSRYRRGGLEAAAARLAAARAIIFDLRGYPSQDAIEWVPYWMTGPDTAQWMTVPRFDAPYARSTSGWSRGWGLQRNPFLEKPAKVLLTDARAISYAESLVGYFAGHKAGRILGEATAGANGNAVSAGLPSGLRYVFTGMRVTRHDGTLFHREGFKPDEVVMPTRAGLASGKDEVLERAIAEVSRP